MGKMTTEEYEALLGEKAHLEMLHDDAINRMNNPPLRRPNDKKYELIASGNVTVHSRDVSGCVNHKRAMMIAMQEDEKDFDMGEDSFIYTITDMFLDEEQADKLLGGMMKIMFDDEKMSPALRRHVNEYFAKCRDQLGNELGITE